VQVVEGPGDQLAHVLGGSLDASAEGQRLLESGWRVTVEQPADVVIASVSGDPARHDLASLAQALANAARVVQPGGQIALLTEATPDLGEAGALIRQAGSPQEALAQLKGDKAPEHLAAHQWAAAVDKAHVYLLSGLPEEVAEDLFTTPLEN